MELTRIPSYKDWVGQWSNKEGREESQEVGVGPEKRCGQGWRGRAGEEVKWDPEFRAKKEGNVSRCIEPVP